MRMAKLRNISLQDVTHILFPRSMAFCKVRCFSSKLEDAAREDKLDFMTASKILFSSPSKPKFFGFDFHLVQFFFACMPSLAVYLVAQYARYDIRRMEADLELKQKQADEKLAEELEQEGQSSSEAGLPGILKERDQDGKLSSSSKASSKEKEEALLELKSRLDTLEKIVKEMASVEARKTSNAEPLTKHGKQPSNGMVASTNGKGNEKDIKEASMRKDAVSTNNAEATSDSHKPDKHLP